VKASVCDFTKKHLANSIYRQYYTAIFTSFQAGYTTPKSRTDGIIKPLKHGRTEHKRLKEDKRYEELYYPIFGLPRIITNEAHLDRFLKLYDSPANSLGLCTGSLGCAKFNNIPAMVRKYSEMGRIGFMHIRNVKIMDDGSFEERAHLSACGSLDMYEIVKALVETGFDGYVRPDHGRMIWDEIGSNAKPGYGLYDRALGATYINGLFEACEKANKAR